MDVTFEFFPLDRKARQQRTVDIEMKKVTGVFFNLDSCDGAPGSNEAIKESSEVVSGSLKAPGMAPFAGKWLSNTGLDLSAGQESLMGGFAGYVIL